MLRCVSADATPAPRDATTIITAARAELVSGDAQTAFATLRGLLSYPASLLTEPAQKALLQDAVAALADASLPIAGEVFGATIAAAAREIDDPEALYDAAYALYEESQYAVAATLLARANQLRPGSAKIVTELASNLEALMLYRVAAMVIEASGLIGHDGFVSYLAIFYDVMCGNHARARERLPLLDDASEQVAQMRERVRAMIERAEALVDAEIALDDRALTAWHAAINGSVLLHESPHGYDDPMHGRYAFVADSPSRMREGLDRLRAVLDAASIRPARIIAAPDRASRILAMAAAEVFALPLESWDIDTHGLVENALVVVWDMRAVGDEQFLTAMHAHAPGRVLFAHASCWTAPFAYAADVTTLLHQVVTHPYLGGALRPNPETGVVERAAPDTRDDAALVAEIVAAGDDGFPSHTPLSLPIAVINALSGLSEETRVALLRGHGQRLRERSGSPVLSARFD